jgi:putative N-acetylmannosamine-6-phosphate epimerase
VGAAFDAGADAVVAGTALTNIDVLVQRFVHGTQRSDLPKTAERTVR